jgi:hypothetical protein
LDGYVGIFDPDEVEAVAMSIFDSALWEHHQIRRRLASIGLDVRRVEYFGPQYVWVVKARATFRLDTESARRLSRQARTVLRELGHDLGRSEPAISYSNGTRYPTSITLAFTSKAHARPGVLRVDRWTNEEVCEVWQWQQFELPWALG